MALTSLTVCVDEQSAPTLTAVLKEMEIVPQVCEDLLGAASQLASQPFDIVLIDFSDEAAALQFTANIRKTSHNKTAQIIALIDARNNVRSLFSAGCNFVLYKPLSVETARDSLRAARGLMRREKRSNKRVRLNKKAAIAYASVENAPATLLDLSETGVRIQSEKIVPATCRVYFQFSLPGQVSVVNIAGEVVWQDSVGRVGLRFANVPQASRKVLTEWLQSNRMLESAPEAPTPQTQTEPETKRFGLGLLQASASDRRIKMRHTCQLGAEVYYEGSAVPNRCTLSDISTDGCYVESTAPFPAGTLLEIVVHTKTLKLRVQGRVQTMHPGFGMGVELFLKTPAQKAQVKQLVDYAAQSGILA
ncbi:MAG TPA: PilZ domain-containing protein [Terriglobales bacterium]|jgi:DNA-binding NarL/FixJ family response regulator